MYAIRSYYAGRNRAALSALLLGFLFVPFFPAGAALAAGNGMVLEGSGISYNFV